MSKFRKKSYDAIPRKHQNRQKDGKADGRKEGQKDRQTLFHRTLQATARGPKDLTTIVLSKRP